MAPVSAAAQAVPAHHEPGRHSRTESKRPLGGVISRRVVGKAIGAAAVGVVGAAALVDLHSQLTPASSDAVTAADVTAEDPAAEELAAAAGAGSVVSATLSSTAAVIAGANSSSGAGVQGSSTSGRGGIFSGAAAQVHLTPGKGATHPKTGQAGDLYVDKTGRLWFCAKTGSKSWKELG